MPQTTTPVGPRWMAFYHRAQACGAFPPHPVPPQSAPPEPPLPKSDFAGDASRQCAGAPDGLATVWG